MLEVGNGSPLWHGTLGPVSTTPAVQGSEVIVAGEDGKLYALSRTTGRDTWKYLGAEQELTASPIALGRLIIQPLVPNPGIIAIDAINGTEIWRTDVTATPVLTRQQDMLLYTSNKLVTIDLDDGSVEKQVPIKTVQTVLPVGDGGVLLVSPSGRLLKLGLAKPYPPTTDRSACQTSCPSRPPCYRCRQDRRAAQRSSTAAAQRLSPRQYDETDAGIDVIPIDQVTGFPEMMDGRVKTLHPKIHGGLLALRDKDDHAASLKEHAITPIDLVCVNLYPFEKTVANPDVSDADAIEQIDIGGPSMVRSSAKNHAYVTIVTDPSQYDQVANDIEHNNGSTTLALRRSWPAAFHGRPMTRRSPHG